MNTRQSGLRYSRRPTSFRAAEPGEDRSPAVRWPEKHFSLARLFGWAALVILAGYLLFAHGCHGDEDNELFSAVRWNVPQAR